MNYKKLQLNEDPLRGKNLRSIQTFHRYEMIDSRWLESNVLHLISVWVPLHNLHSCSGCNEGSATEGRHCEEHIHSYHSRQCQKHIIISRYSTCHHHSARDHPR